MNGDRRTAGWGGFAAWGLVGVLFSLSVVGAASIGLFLLPVAVLALIAAVVVVRVWPEITGVLEGVAASSFYLGLADLSLGARGGVAVPWLLGGLAFAGTGLIAYSFTRLRS